MSGRAATVEHWLGRKDEPGDHECTWEPLAIGGDTVLQGRTVYRGRALDTSG